MSCRVDPRRLPHPEPHLFSCPFPRTWIPPRHVAAEADEASRYPRPRPPPPQGTLSANHRLPLVASVQKARGERVVWCQWEASVVSCSFPRLPRSPRLLAAASDSPRAAREAESDAPVIVPRCPPCRPHMLQELGNSDLTRRASIKGGLPLVEGGQSRWASKAMAACQSEQSPRRVPAGGLGMIVPRRSTYHNLTMDPGSWVGRQTRGLPHW